MRKLFTLLLAGLFLAVSLNAQQHLFLGEEEINLEDGKFVGWVFPATASQELTLNDFKDYLKGRSDLKLKKEGDDILIAEKVSLPAISTKRGDLIAYCRITEQFYSMAIIFRLGYDISISRETYPEEMESMRHYVKEFMSFHYEQEYGRRIKELEKQLKELEKIRDQTEKKVGNINGKIASNQKKIAKETDEGKIGVLEAENNNLQTEANTLSNTLPEMLSQIDGLKKEIEANKDEVNSFLSTIVSL